MTMIINPGSRVGDPEPDGDWQNTLPVARRRAEVWLGKMHDEGMTGVELLDGSESRDGRWLFTFRHKTTGATATLEMHGIDPTEAYEREYVFTPRVYWNGSSSADPCLEDFAAPGFKAVRTFVPEASLSPAEDCLTHVPMVCTTCRKPVTRGPITGLWFHSDTSDPERCSRTVPVKAMVEAGNENVPRKAFPVADEDVTFPSDSSPSAPLEDWDW